MSSNSSVSSASAPPALADPPELLAAWQILYRFTAFALSDPRRAPFSRWETISSDSVLEQAAALIRSEPRIVPQSFGPCEKPPGCLAPERVLAHRPTSADEWNAWYEQTFGLLVASGAPAYETEYISGKLAFQRSNTLADLAGFYQAFGLAIPSECPERVDHISLELEFMACLLELERQAQAEGTDAQAVCRQARCRFFQEHLGWWGVGMASLLQEATRPPFYQRIGEWLAALLTAQRAYFAIPVRERVAQPQDPNEAGGCDDCLIANL